MEKERKPLKRSEHIVKLSKDHHTTLLFCWKIRMGIKFGVETERIKNYVLYFWNQHMQPHFIQEETILFVTVNDTAVQRAIGEHVQIKQQINLLDRASEDVNALLKELAEMIDHHVRYEERELFPHLEKTLTGEQLKSIGFRLQRLHDPLLKDDYEDEFWLRKTERNGAR